jgi:hypothetical protein
MRDLTGKEIPKWRRKTWLRCKKCGHTWKPRISNPNECPRCRRNDGWVRITANRLRKEKLLKEKEKNAKKLQELRNRLK